MTTPDTPNPLADPSASATASAKRGPSQHPGLSRRAPHRRAAPANPGPIGTGSDAAHWVRCGWRALAPALQPLPTLQGRQYDGIEHAGLPSRLLDSACSATALKCSRVPITAVHGEPSPFGVRVGRPAASRQRGAGIIRIREQRNRDGLLLVNEMPRDWGRSVIRVSRAPTE